MYLTEQQTEGFCVLTNLLGGYCCVRIWLLIEGRQRSCQQVTALIVNEFTSLLASV